MSSLSSTVFKKKVISSNKFNFFLHFLSFFHEWFFFILAQPVFQDQQHSPSASAGPDQVKKGPSENGSKLKSQLQ